MFLPVSAAVPATIGIVVLSAVLIACLKQGTAAYKFFTLEKVVYLGLISYSLYLWHWTVLSISRWTIGIHWWSVPIQVGLMVLMAIGSYKWIEKIYGRKTQMPTRMGVFTFGMSALGASSLISVALLGNSENLYAGKRKSEQIQLPPDIYAQKSCSNAYRLLIIGDSHAGHFEQEKKKICSNYAIDIQVLEEGGMPFPTAIYSNPFHGTFKKKIIGGANKLQKLWGNAKVPAMGKGAVMLSNRSLWYFDHKNSDDSVNSVPVRYSKEDTDQTISDFQFFNEWKRNLSELLTKYSGTTFIYALPNPEFRVLSVAAPMCKKEWFRPTPSGYCFNTGIRLEHAKKHLYFKTEIETIARRHDNFLVFDYFDLICPNFKSNCNVMSKSNMPLYRDVDHFTKHGAEKVIERLSVFLKAKDLTTH